MKKILLPIVAIAVVLAVGVVFLNSQQNQSEDFLVRNNLVGMDVMEIVEYLEKKTDEPIGFNAGITATKLVLSDTKGSIELNVPKDLFYLSIAPYINTTHPCGTHNLVSCRGELQGETLHVLITDMDTNEVVLDQDVDTYANGFAGLWLPRNRNLSVTVTYKDLSATTQVSTNDDDNTCETTLKLV